jgi:hypothetical protein
LAGRFLTLFLAVRFFVEAFFLVARFFAIFMAPFSKVPCPKRLSPLGTLNRGRRVMPDKQAFKERKTNPSSILLVCHSGNQMDLTVNRVIQTKLICHRPPVLFPQLVKLNQLCPSFVKMNCETFEKVNSIVSPRAARQLLIARRQQRPIVNDDRRWL